ncbi:MAG: GDP-mannose 4,6-dehydratase [Candidatus Cloacimonetes bacterium]|nr:GDP-mannose 4,6-dehydratase [Candidatus Cloacimonadota bacterium]
MYNFIVTGGCGFIGSHFIELILSKGYSVLNIDKMTYVSWDNIGFENHKNYDFWKQDICDISNLPKCDYLVNFAAESFVDNSIENSEVFFNSNVQGVHNLIEHIRMKAKFDRPVFIQISTDEVYGDTNTGKFTEKDVLKPSNPYSATKAAAEQFVLAYNRTYGIDYIITRSSNNYGIRQYPEKLIPKTIVSGLNNRKMTIHGDGSYIRSWIHVRDNCAAILSLIENNCFNDIFNICSGLEYTNLEIVNMVYDSLGTDSNLQFVDNRWGQDVRYSISTDKIKNKISWKVKYDIKKSMHEMIKFYKDHK